MEEASIKKIETIIKESLKRGSIFCLRDGLRFAPEGNVSENKEEAVQLLIANGIFSLREYFLLSVIHSLGYATVPMIVRKLALEKRKNPQLEIPHFDIRALKKRLKWLVQYGLLYSFSYDAENTDTKVVIYVCTMIGWRAFRTRLMVNIPFDKLAIYRSTSDIFRRLAANSVAFSFAANELCSEVTLHEAILYGNDMAQKKITIFAQAVLENSCCKRRYLIEPVYFKIEPEVITEEQYVQQIEERIRQLQDMIEYYIEKEAWDVKLVFVVENLEGLMKLLSMLKQKELSFFMKYATFTSENVIANNNYQLGTSFLKIAIVENKGTMKLDQTSILENV